PKIRSVAIRADRLARGPGAEAHVGSLVNRLFQELDRPVAEQEVRTAGMLAMEAEVADLPVPRGLERPGLVIAVINRPVRKFGARQARDLEVRVDPGQGESHCLPTDREGAGRAEKERLEPTPLVHPGDRVVDIARIFPGEDRVAQAIPDGGLAVRG